MGAKPSFAYQLMRAWHMVDYNDARHKKALAMGNRCNIVQTSLFQKLQASEPALNGDESYDWIHNPVFDMVQMLHAPQILM